MRRLPVLILIAHLQVQTPVDAHQRYNTESDDQRNLDDDRLFFVGEHDHYRRYVALGVPIAGKEIPPKAANMMEMQYSCELERKAVKLIESCPEELKAAPLDKLEYNVDKVTGLDTRREALKMAILYWATTYQTLKGIKGRESSLIPSNNTRSAWPFYTMMNAETSKVGCAVKKCDSGYYIACYYGNKLATSGAAIYKEGDPCSQCPKGTYCFKWEGLCN